ncbi:MAG: hypothetical protein ACRDIV_16150 [Ktedonobacteraceae bacterium]
MGCLRRFFRLIILVALIIVALIFLVPHFVAKAGNSLINDLNNNLPSLSGLAQFVPANFLDKNNKLQISLSGLTNSTKYEVTLDPDQCGNSGYVDLGVVSADGNGNVNDTFSLASLDGGKKWFIDIHNGTSVNDSVLGCGQLSTNDSSASAEATNTVLQLSPVATQVDNTQVSPGATPTTPTGFPNTGVAPGSNNSYDNTVYPRKF